MNELIVCKQCGAVLSSDYIFCDKCGSMLQNKNIKIQKDRIEKKRTHLKASKQREKIFEWKKVLFLKGCPMCGSSKLKKIKKKSIEYVQPRKWTDSGSHPWGPPSPNGIQKRYIYKYGCRQCGHIWIECTKYRFKRV